MLRGDKFISLQLTAIVLVSRGKEVICQFNHIDQDDIFTDNFLSKSEPILEFYSMLSQKMSYKSVYESKRSINFLNTALKVAESSNSTNYLKYQIYRDMIDLIELNPTLTNQLSINILDILSQLSEIGDENAQFNLASIYGTGIYTGLVPMDAGRSSILAHSSALSGDYLANMAMGYKYLYGIGLQESCELALKHYEYSANEAAKTIEKRGYPLYSDKSYLYNIKTKTREIDEELVDFYTYLSTEGDVNAALALATMYMQGSKQLNQNYNKAIDCLYISSLSSNKQSSSALALLGYLLILGYQPSNPISFTIADIIEKLTTSKDPVAITALGYANYKGIGIKANITKAIELFQSVSNKHIDAGFYLGEIYMGRGIPDGVDSPKIDMTAASQFYKLSSHKGNILALHRVGIMSAMGLGGPRHCPSAVNALKSVSEKGDWMTELTVANKLYSNGNSAAALIKFSKFAFIGVEVAQSNTAHILTKTYCPNWLYPSIINLSNNNTNIYNLPISEWLTQITINETIYLPEDAEEKLKYFEKMVKPKLLDEKPQLFCELRGLQLYSLSSDQKNPESFVRIGDLYYYGLGGLKPNKLEAINYYQKSADLKLVHGIFNLGLIYQFGDGIPQDFHLAKRYFDQAADISPDSKLSRSIALLLMSTHQILLYFIGLKNLEKFYSTIYPIIQSTYLIIVKILTITNKNQNYKQQNYFHIQKYLQLFYGSIMKFCTKSLSKFYDNFYVSISINFYEKQVYNYFTKFLLNNFELSENYNITIENYLLIGLTLLLLYLIEVVRRRRNIR